MTNRNHKHLSPTPLILTKTYATEIDGEQVPYTVSENKDVCSSCAEFFNVISEESRKLARACPGSITLVNMDRDVYYDIKPVKFQPKKASAS